MGGSDPQRQTYRPDIDGLRAVAVLSVIGFHADAAWVPGGYVGVDIFFVISGFLITSIICRQLHQDTFTFTDFYARRCKRIFPALLIVLAAVLFYGWIFLLPNEYERLGKHVAAGGAFISNFVFWGESGYFDKAAESKPLLHLWSLGIEEQFYLLWPPLLVWAWRRKRDVLTITIGIVCASFAFNVMLVSLWQASGMYYLPPTRFWELLLGGALAYAQPYRKDELENVLKRVAASLRSCRLSSIENVQATTGLFLIVAALAGLNNRTLFPGWWGLLPTLGSLLLISAGPHAWINRRVLASRPLVFVGLISYPLYLWHWPLLSYARIMVSDTPSIDIRAAAIGAAFWLSWLTYRLIEQPARSKPNRAALMWITNLSVVVCLGLAVFLGQLHSRSNNYGMENIVKAAAGNWEFPGPRLKSVQTEHGYHFERGSGPRKVLFTGDSHMEQYYARVDRLFEEHPDTTKGVFFVTQRSCPPLHEMPGLTLPRNCAELAENALSIADRPDVDTVVIGAAWNRYEVFDSAAANSAFRDLSATITRYKKTGRNVYVILPIPRGDAFDPASLVHRSLVDFGFVVRRQVQRSDVDATLKPIAMRLQAVANAAGATAIDPVRYVCNDTYCPTLADDGLPIYVDNSHLRPAYVREHMTFLDDLVSMRD